MKSPSPPLQHPPSPSRLDSPPPLSCGVSVWLLGVKLFEATYHQIGLVLACEGINLALDKLRKSCHILDLRPNDGGFVRVDARLFVAVTLLMAGKASAQGRVTPIKPRMCWQLNLRHIHVRGGQQRQPSGFNESPALMQPC